MSGMTIEREDMAPYGEICDDVLWKNDSHHRLILAVRLQARTEALLPCMLWTRNAI